MDEQADGAAEEYTDDATGTGQNNCFGEELPDDVAAARAERFAYADFTGTLSDRHQHDIHYAYAANQKADGADHGNQERDRRCDLAKFVGDLLGAGDAEIIRLAVTYVSPAAQHTADLVLGFGHAPGIGRGADEVLVILRNVFVVTAVRHHYPSVGGLILDETAFARFKDANYFVGDAADHDGLSQRVHVGIKLFGNV